MIRKLLAIGILLAGVNLAGCSSLPMDLGSIARLGKNGAQKETEQTETSQEQEEETSQEDPEEMIDEEDLEEAIFKSTASVVQMEVTTGLTTEYLANLCNFPIIIDNGEEEMTMSDERDLEALGLDAIYTEALLQAIGDFDTEQLQIKEGKAVMGDMDTAYIILGRSEDDVVGIEEICCGK